MNTPLGWERRNYWRLVVKGLRRRIETAKFGSHLLFLYSALFNAWEQIA